MSDQINHGLWAWKQSENNNRMIDLQQGRRSQNGPLQLAYFGGSAFRITTPAGLSVLIDPWRNPPAGTTRWFLSDFPDIEVDIGLSTHAHFDHDNLHSLRASTLLDRPVGRFEFADMVITGIADKHVSDSRHCDVDWARITEERSPMITKPPHNWRSFDNTLIVVETGGLRILHWGDNRPDVSDQIWDMIGDIDIALLPIDGSQHVLGYDHAAAIMNRLSPKITVPCHYHIDGVTDPASTLKPATDWVALQSHVKTVPNGTVPLPAGWVKAQNGLVMTFGEQLASA